MGHSVDFVSAVNFSEGRRPDVIRAIVAAAGRACPVADISSDPDHNRTVVTLLGDGAMLTDAILHACEAAVELIEIGSHRGVHPRLGAVDVVPFAPVAATIDQAVDHALRCAERLWRELSIPCFLYEAAARTPAASSLPWIRRSAFKELAPDIGGPGPHPSAGATVVGAREELVAFNLNLGSANLELACAIAARIRDGALPGVRSLGLLMAARNRAQVSVNITRVDQVSMLEVLHAVDRLAGDSFDFVESTELIGLAPRRALGTDQWEQLKLSRAPAILEAVVESLPEWMLRRES
ncbi:MAG: glutamate formimidoyltransferase [Actinomycetota bacterium]